jgi:hypothetical protein
MVSAVFPTSRLHFLCAHLSVSGAILIVVALVVVWAVFFRPRSRHHFRVPGRSRSRRHREETEVSRDVAEAPASRRHHQGRRRRRELRPRNPTLAETGGLPPRRQTQPLETSG